jgi:hypothetical protein
VPGAFVLVLAFLLLGYSGSRSNGGGNKGMPELALGLVALLPGVILLSPFCLSMVARLGRQAPIAVRLPLRDLARHRARSGSALSAISVGVLIAVIISVVSAARYGNVLAPVTAAALGFLGALLGTVAGYIGVVGWIRTNSLNGGVSALGNIPVDNLLVILVGMPLVAVAAGWSLASREPLAVGRQPLE